MVSHGSLVDRSASWWARSRDQCCQAGRLNPIEGTAKTPEGPSSRMVGLSPGPGRAVKVLGQPADRNPRADQGLPSLQTSFSEGNRETLPSGSCSEAQV